MDGVYKKMQLGARSEHAPTCSFYLKMAHLLCLNQSLKLLATWALTLTIAKPFGHFRATMLYFRVFAFVDLFV